MCVCTCVFCLYNLKNVYFSLFYPNIINISLIILTIANLYI